MAHTCPHRYVHNDTHLDSITSLIFCPLYVTPFGSFTMRHCLSFCASRLSAHIVTDPLDFFKMYCYKVGLEGIYLIVIFRNAFVNDLLSIAR